MNKQDILSTLDALEAQIHGLREELLNDPSDAIKFPTYFNLPIGELNLKGLKQVNRFFNACARHMIATVGQLVTSGRATVAKWPNIGDATIAIVSAELRERWGLNW